MARKRPNRDTGTGAPESRKQQHLTRRDQERRKLLLGLTVPLLAVAVGVLLVGIFRDKVQVPSTPIAEVSGERLTAGSFMSRIQYERRLLLNQVTNLRSMMQTNDPAIIQQFIGGQRETLPKTVQDKLIDEAIIRQEAISRTLTVSEADVDEAIYGELATALAPPPTAVAEVMPTATVSGTAALSGTAVAALPPTASPTAGPTSVPISTEEIGRQYERRIEPMLQQLEMSAAEYREIVRQQVYRDKLTKDMADKLPTAVDQVDVEYLLFKDKATAEEAAAALAAGSSWASVLAQFGPTPTPPPDATPTPTVEPTVAVPVTGTPPPTPTSTPEPQAFETGEGGWFSQAKLVKEWALSEADAGTVLGLAANSFSQALSGGRGFYVLAIRDAEKNRPVDEAELTQQKETVLDEWLTARRKALEDGGKINRYPLEAFVLAEPLWFSQGFDQLVATPIATIPGSGIEVSTVVPPAGQPPAPDLGGIQISTPPAPAPAP